MAKLIGTDPNQVPTNGDLGTMAYQDYDVVAPQFLAGGRRNLIINGAMQVAQRGTSWTNPTGEYTIDRCEFANSNLGTWNVSQSTDAPAGFKYSAKATCTTADASPASGDYVFFRHNLEGHNIAHLNYGSSNAKELTLSFWVKSNKTGTIGVETQTATSYERTADVTINASDTWEYKTVLIPANTDYSTNEDNNLGMRIYFWLNAGSSFKGTPTSTWGTGHSGRGGTLTAGIGGATSDYFAITGIQLEVGSVATLFEHRSYGEELALCQRYYFNTDIDTGNDYASLIVNAGDYNSYQFKVRMRTPPTMTLSPALGTLSNLSVSNSGFYVQGTSTSSINIEADAEL